MTVGQELALLLAPLVGALSSGEAADGLLRELDAVETPAPPAELPAELATLAAATQEAIDAVLALDDPAVSAIERTAGLVVSLTALFDAVADLTRLDASSIEKLGAPYDAPDLWPFLAETLPVWLVNRWLRDGHPALYDALVLLDVVTDDGGVQRLDFARLTSVATSFSASVGEVLANNPGLVVAPLRRAFDARGVAVAGPPRVLLDGQTAVTNEAAPAGNPERLDLAVRGGAGRPALGVTVEPVETEAGPGLAISANGLDRLSAGVMVADGWTVETTGGPGVAGLVIGADWAEKLDGLVDALGSASLSLVGRPEVPWALFGNAGATRLELANLTVGLDGDALTSSPDFALTLATEGLRFVLSAADSDSFLATLLAGGEVTADMPVAARWSPRDGLTIDGSFGLEIRIPLTKTIGLITVSGLTLALTVEPGDAVALTVTTTIGAQIGPVSAVVDGMGLAVEVRSDPAAGVPVGPIGVGLAFVPPKGVGLGLNAGVAVGGGYLWFDYDEGKYTGVLDVDILAVGISAVVIIETEAPDVDGWSMFFALFLELPSIQLGFGFTLNGVGGLIGLNRTLDVEALQAAVRSGALGSALFPENPIADAPIIIDTFRTMFPPADGRTVFGPVVAIGWGTPTLIEAELGIVISLPDPITIAVLGSITSVLPTAEVDLVAINLDVAGVIDQAAGTLSIDASLHDSHIVGFALSGDMALRADFTDAPSFLLSLGGFHPGFIPPAGFPALTRLSLAIDAGSVLQVRFDSYLALTSNTVQFGAGIFVSANIEGFGIEGGVDFDALIQFSPFLVKTDLGFHVSITAAGLDLAGVWLDVSLEGPNPWFVVGSARFKVLGIETEVRVDEQIGSRRPEPAVDAADLLGAVRTALGDNSAWSTVATAIRDVVAVASPAAAGELVAEPDGIVRVAQRVAPMAINIERVGEAPVGTYNTFDLEPGEDGMAATGDVLDWFAPASFFDISPTEGLAAPSFELLKAGIEFGGGDPISGQARPTKLGYEQILRDPELDDDVVLEGEYLPLDGSHQLAATAFGTLAGADLAVATDDGESFAVMSTGVVVTHGRSGRVLATASSWSAAHQSVANAGSNVLRAGWEVPA